MEDKYGSLQRSPKHVMPLVTFPYYCLRYVCCFGRVAAYTFHNLFYNHGM